MPEWQTARSAQVALQMKGGSRVGGAKKTAFREDVSEDGRVRWVKGLAAWETWQGFFQRKTAKFTDEPGVRGTWEQRAVQWNIDHPRDALPLVPARPPLSQEDSYFGMGSYTCPIRPELLAATAAKWTTPTPVDHPTANREAGPVSSARRISKATAGDLFIQDPRPAGQALPPLTGSKHVCFDVHPGLCITRDHFVMHLVKDICQNLNTLCSSRKQDDLIGRLWRFDFLLSSLAVPGTFVHKHSDQ